MKKQITLNEYDESALKDLLEHVLETERNSFITIFQNSGKDFDYLSEIKSSDYLLWKCSSKQKEHVYYKAVVLYQELNSASEVE